MGMGYAANISEVIEVEEIKKLKLESFAKFEEALKESRVSLDVLASHLQFDSDITFEDDDIDEDRANKIVVLYESFVEEFKKKYKIGLHLNYHDQEDVGSRYDEVDGAFFELDFTDMYELTEAAKKLKQKVSFEMKAFVSYG